jgi:hypothetical protein
MGPMSGSSEIVGAIGERALALPQAIRSALLASDRLKYCFSVFQLAERCAGEPGTTAPDLRAEREACGLTDASLDEVIASCQVEDVGLHLKHAAILHRVVVDALEDMIALLALSPSTARAAAELHERVQALLATLPPIEGDHVPCGYVSQLTRAVEGQDSIQELVVALRRLVDEFQASLARDGIDGAVVYGIAEDDRFLVQAFMRGVNRTSSLRFDHPGLGTIATRSDGALIIQSDIGSSDGHLLLTRISGLACAVTYVAPHLQTVRFFQALFTGFDVAWSETRSREARWLAEGEMYKLSGRLAATERAGLERFLERLGSRIVFFIDLNRARKRLRNFIDGPGSIEVLRWAVDQEVGLRAFLQLGGERLVYEAIESASPSPLRYGQRLDEILGRRPAIEFLQFMLRATSEGLLHHRSERFIRDEIRADLLGRFETLEHGVLGVAA